MTNEVIKKLSEAALDVRKKAYCPYSGFAVGAALLAKSGEIYTGVNIENAAFTPTNCAERTAFFTAIAKGERDFVAVAIAGGKAGEEPEDFCAPCGVCRQVMRVLPSAITSPSCSSRSGSKKPSNVMPSSLAKVSGRLPRTVSASATPMAVFAPVSSTSARVPPMWSICPCECKISARSSSRKPRRRIESRTRYKVSG